MVGGIRPSANRVSDRAISGFLVRARDGEAPKKKLFDGGGLDLTLTPAATAAWRIKYRFHGKERLIALGVHPEVRLAEARAKRDTIRAQLRAGLDPVVERVIEWHPIQLSPTSPTNGLRRGEATGLRVTSKKPYKRSIAT